MGIQDLAARIAAAKASKAGNYIKPGKYVFEIQKLIADKMRGGNMFVVEMTVVSAQQTDPAYSPNVVGSSVSYVVNMDKDSGMGNVKSFIMAVLDVPETEVTAEAVVELLGPSEPLRFARIADEAFNRPMRSKPNEMFTNHRWEYIQLTPEECGRIAAAREEERKRKEEAKK